MEPDERRLTAAELEIMRVFWERGECTVHDVLAALGEDRAYTTISTLIRILEQKGCVDSRKDGRRHFYRAVTEKRAYEHSTVRDLVRRLFDRPAAVVRSLLEAGDLDQKELEEIRRLIDQEKK